MPGRLAIRKRARPAASFEMLPSSSGCTVSSLPRFAPLRHGSSAHSFMQNSAQRADATAADAGRAHDSTMDDSTSGTAPSESGTGSAAAATAASGQAPARASTHTSTLSNPSTKDSASQHSHRSGGSISSLFHRDHHHHHEASHESAIGHMLAPALSVAGAHNPFSISALCEDGSRKKTHQYGKSDKNGPSSSSSMRDVTDDDGDTDTLKRRTRKRDKIRSAFGRSLSPWRYHNEQSAGRRSGSWNLSRQSRDSLDVQRDKQGHHPDVEQDIESDAESIKSGIVPRNSAFGHFSEDDSDSEDEMNASEVRSRIASGKEPHSKTDEEEGVHVAAKDDATIKSESINGGDDEGVSGEQTADEDSDDYIDFDEKTLDNTLYNAGCIDLHDAWLKDGHVHHSHDQGDAAIAQAHYGPGDFDAAWQGAGPSGHDEGDEGLRAPNVVIGENQSLSPSEITGEGMDILNINEGVSNLALAHNAHLRPSAMRRASQAQSFASSSVSSEKGAESASIASVPTSLSSLKDAEGTATGTTDSSQSAPASQRLTASRPIFEKNRCTITLVHGEYALKAQESKRPRRYIVASDGSEESSYAIEWTIGTVLRDGDEMLVVSVMETDTKLDASDKRHEDKLARQEHQRIRQSMAVILARRAVAVLQRTRLAVRISCQALHARNSRHMFIDMIDFFEPTMCVVGSRGLGSLKGVLLGSFSHYCVQKSPVPVMVVRKRLKLPPLPKGKTDVVSNVRARHMRLDQALIEKDANVADEAPDTNGEMREEEEDEEKSSKGDGVTGEEDGRMKRCDVEASETVDDGTATIRPSPPTNEGIQKEQSLRPDGIGERRGSAEQAAQVEKEKEEESAIKRDAAQANELQQEKDGKKHAKKQKDQVIADEKSSTTDRTGEEPAAVAPQRGRKKFSVGMGDDDEDEDADDEDTRGRSLSRTSEPT